MRLKLITLTFFLLCFVSIQAQRVLLIAVQSPKDSVVRFDLQNGKRQGQVKVGFLPHEITYDPISKKCFISNFGLQDYDFRIGKPGNSISVIDPLTMENAGTIYTTADTSNGNGPHGIKIRPGQHRELYTNIEIGGDSMLIYDAETYGLKRKFPLPKSTHNFIFSTDGSKLWIMAASEGVYEVSPKTGHILHHQVLSSPIRGLAMGKKWIVASGNNEVFLLSKINLQVLKHFTNLHVGQILYSNLSSDQKTLLCPAVEENMLLVIDIKSEKVIHRLPTFKGPVNVQILKNTAYVSHDEDNFIAVINLKDYTIQTLPVYGTNGLLILQ